MLVKQLVANPFQHCSSVDLKSEDKNVSLKVTHMTDSDTVNIDRS